MFTCSLTLFRHFYPDATTRFPALARVPHLQPMPAFILSGLICMSLRPRRPSLTSRRHDLAGSVLEGLSSSSARDPPFIQAQFVIIDRRKKIESGQRTTSFSFLLNDKRGVIGRMLAAVPPQYREVSFMAGQLGTSSVSQSNNH